MSPSDLDRGPLTGTWTVRGDQFCTALDDGDKACWIIVRHGDNCFAYHVAPEKTTGNTLPENSQWLAIGWNPAKRSTCPQGLPRA